MKYLLNKFGLLIFIAALVNIPIIFAGTITTDYAVNMKGGTNLIDNVMEVDADYEEAGSFSSVYVLSMNHSTILQNEFVKADYFLDFYKMSTSTASNTSTQNYNIGKIQYNSSIQQSIIFSYTMAKPYNSDIVIDYSMKSLAITYVTNRDNSSFKVCDEIIEVNGVSIKDWDSFVPAYNYPSVGTKVKVIRDDNEVELTITEFDLGLRDDSTNYFSIGFYKLYDIDYDTLKPAIKRQTNNVGGPSGGLLQSLAVFNKLTPVDYTRGLKISGTGTINMSGTVGAIGGVKQKVAAAYDENVDVFFCPKDNYNDALEAYNRLPSNKMKLIMVEKFEDAIKYLAEDYKNDFQEV